MIKNKTEHSFASSVLRKNGFKIFVAGKEILNQYYPQTDNRIITILPKDTDYKRQFLENIEHEKIMDVKELLDRFGFKIQKYKSKEAFTAQRIAYQLVRSNYNAYGIQEKMPQNHYVLYDAINNCCAMFGKNTTINGHTEWLPVDINTIPRDFQNKPHTLNLQGNVSFYQKKLTKTINFTTKREVFYIQEIVIGISQEGFFVCMPQVVSSYMPTGRIDGSAGQGKSILLHLLQDGYNTKYEVPCIDINGISDEAKTRCLKWNNCGMYDDLKRFGENSTRIPAVYLHPSTKGSLDSDKIYPEEVGFDISLRWKDIILNPDLLDINEAWEMKKGGSQLKWKELIYRNGEVRKDGLYYKESYEDIIKFLDTQNLDKGTYEKIFKIINDIWNSKCIDKSSGIASQWILQSKDIKISDTAWVICMKAGLFPYLITSGIRGELWYPLWLKTILLDLMRYARQSPVPLMIFSDEIAELLKNKSTKAIIEKIIRELRKQGVGFFMVSHSGKDVPDEIGLHMKYNFIFKTTDDDSINLAKKLGLTKERREEIPKLKQFQCFAFGDFVLYDTDGNRFSNEGKPIKIIKIKVPNSRHHAGK